ncbi:MAG: putative DNA-binding domain-containing protein [Myxococcota bacterium]
MSGRLDTAQRELARWLRAPDGVRAALAAEGDREGRALLRRIRGDRSAGAIARVEIYANAYFFRIRDALATEYEALAAALGEAGFHDLVTAYLIAHPSRDPSLRWVGRALPGFLADAAGAAAFRRRWPWAPDLARLEWALSGAFDAADARPLGRDDLARVEAGRWVDLVFALHPSVSLLGLAWPGPRLLSLGLEGSERVSEDEGGDARQTPAPEPTNVVVWRGRGTPRHRVVSDEEMELLEALRRGAPFGELCERAASVRGPDGAASRVAGWLAGWVESELLVWPSGAG